MLPKLSVIVVTWNNENYIEQAIRSCVADRGADYEIIVVHNASADQTGKIVARVAAEYPSTIRVIENHTNVGLGEARNIGVDAARGDYVMFLDGDDWYREGAVEEAIHMAASASFELYVFSYLRWWPWGRSQAAGGRHVLRQGNVSDPERRAKIFAFFGIACNKMYSRQFLARIKLRFEPGFYEDIVWNFKCLTQAKTVFATDKPFFMYRQRPGSILKSSDNRHFDAIKRAREILDYIRENPHIRDTYGKAIVKYVCSQCLGVLMAGGRIPRAKETKYLKEANQVILELRSEVGSSITKKEWVARLNSPLLLRFAVKINQRLKAKLKPAKKVVQKLESRLSPAVFRLSCRFARVDPNKVFYDSFWGAKAACNPRAIFDALSREQRFKHVWHLKPGVPPPTGAGAARLGTFRAAYHMATAGYVVSNVNLPNFYIKRNGTKTVQTRHGTPLKLMGLDIMSRKPREMNWRALLHRSSQWDLEISSNPASTRAWNTASPYDRKILEIGYPRNDVFFNSTEADVSRLRATLNIPDGKKVALYAPTFRDAKQRGFSAEWLSFDSRKVLEALGEDYVLLLRSHYFFTASVDTLSERILDVSGHPEANEVCLVSDLLITDFSSIMFDYACLRRPIILFAPDIDEYEAERGTYFDIRSLSPAPVFGNMDDLCLFLWEKGFATEAFERRTEEFADIFAPWDDGQATDRALEQVFGVKRHVAI